MHRVGSAVLGAVSFQLAHLALEAPQSRAAWGWSMDVPPGLGFTCEEGSTIAGAAGSPDSDFDCTVVPDSGMECDVSSTSIVCYKTATPSDTFIPTAGLCINNGHPPDMDDNDSAIMWSTVPSCTEVDTTVDDMTSNAPMASAVGAAVAVSVLCV
mmetsp:Transcript_24086/g.63550  ORF Transcript_24086/g.63550 Transcript_24086/m.63550 type:complete len:155 (+) Transcript_24086:72-536(+)